MIDDIEHDEGQEGEVDSETDFRRRVARRRPGADVEAMLRQLQDTIEQARPAPLSTAVKIDRDVALDVLDQAIERLPEELRNARWLLKEREEFLARTHREADEILAAARGQAERMVQRSEVLRSAEAKARRVVEVARSDASRIRNECDDYCDQRLAKLEAVLERAMGVISEGRERLRPKPEDEPPNPFEDLDDETSETPLGTAGSDDDVDAEPVGSAAFFDQDRS
jgi:chromosome segregation ATPase